MSNPQSPIPNPEFPIPDLPCVLFAGGKSSRMGHDKALLPFGGCKTLAEYQYLRLRKIFQEVFISTKEEKFPFPAPLIRDTEGSDVYAPTAGLLAACETLEKDFFALSVDTPFVDAGVVTRLYEAYREGAWDAVVSRTPSGSHPMCALYTRNIQPALEAMVREGDHRLRALLKKVNVKYVDFDDDSLFFNLNRPEEYVEARKRIGDLR